MTSEGDPVAEVELLFRRWLVAAVDCDDAFFAEHLADEFRYVNAGGVVFTKQGLIDVNKLVEDNAYSLLDFGGRRYGSLVVAHGEYHAKGEIPDGTAPQGVIDLYRKGGRLKLSTVWEQRPEGYRALLLQTTPVLG
jgi:hypothetical protein